MPGIAKRVRWRLILLHLLIASLSFASCSLPYQSSSFNPIPSPTVKNWKLIFDDEFNGPSLDQTKWNAIEDANPPNKELEYYVPDDVSVSDGKLVLKSERRSYRRRDYTSARVDSYGKFSFTYGKVEIRAKEPQSGQGIWPTLWLLGNDCNPQYCNWPADGANELDIAEQFNEPRTVYMTPHAGPQRSVSLSLHACRYTGPDYSAKYHVFSVVWEQGGKITWYIDGIQRCQSEIPGYFETPMYIVLNTAIGGRSVGKPDSSTPFPQYHLIDYVRVYQQT